MSEHSRPYVIHSDDECERLELQAQLAKSNSTSDTCRYRLTLGCLTQVVDQAPCQG